MAALETLVRDVRPQAEIEVATTLGPVVGTHAGPGTVGPVLVPGLTQVNEALTADLPSATSIATQKTDCSWAEYLTH